MMADAKFETRDREGNLLRYNADDDEMTLGELVRQEKFGAGAADQKNLDAEMASAIGRDARFQVGLLRLIIPRCPQSFISVQPPSDLLGSEALPDEKAIAADGRTIWTTWMTTRTNLRARR